MQLPCNFFIFCFLQKEKGEEINTRIDVLILWIWLNGRKKYIDKLPPHCQKNKLYCSLNYTLLEKYTILQLKLYSVKNIHGTASAALCCTCCSAIYFEYTVRIHCEVHAVNTVCNFVQLSLCCEVNSYSRCHYGDKKNLLSCHRAWKVNQYVATS